MQDQRTAGRKARPVSLGERVTINRSPYNRPNPVMPDAPRPTHRVVGFAPGGWLIIASLTRGGRSRLASYEALRFPGGEVLR